MHTNLFITKGTMIAKNIRHIQISPSKQINIEEAQKVEKFLKSKGDLVKFLFFERIIKVSICKSSFLKSIFGGDTVFRDMKIGDSFWFIFSYHTLENDILFSASELTNISIKSEDILFVE